MPSTGGGMMQLLKQQRLPAWQPILTPPYVALGFIIVSIICIPLASLISVLNQQTSEITFRYDDIHKCTSQHNTEAFTYEGNGIIYKTGCLTNITFEITTLMHAPVYLYYGLTNFYQNHRRYSKSRSDTQLAGEIVRSIPDANPLVIPGDITGTSEKSIKYKNLFDLQYRDFVYVPAGLIAWSMFNDTFTLYKKDGEDKISLICNGTDFSKRDSNPLGGSISENMCTKKGVAWESDVKYKFKTPNLDAGQRLWTAAYEFYTGEKSNDILSNDSFLNNGWYADELGHEIPVTTDEDLMVWMRAASLPSFRKLYRVINTDLLPGKYVMEIGEHYDVSSFGGTKSFTLATLSWLGGNNKFLAAMYFAVGGISFIFALILLLVYRFCGDRSSRAIDDLLKK